MERKNQFINLTDYNIIVVDEKNTVTLNLPPSDLPCVIKTTLVKKSTPNELINLSLTKSANLPAEEEDTFYVVTKEVKYRLSHQRYDLVLPHNVIQVDKVNKVIHIKNFLI